MDELIRVAGAGGVEEIVVGMAHRGRLNVLVNTLGKLPKMLFAEFEGKAGGDLTAGDVKYHMGFSSDVMTAGGPVPPHVGLQPISPRDRQSGRRGLGVRASAAPRHRRRQGQGPAGADPR